MKILVTGINGQVGWEVVRKGVQSGYKIIGLNREALDITNANAVSRIIEKNSPDVVINCAAYTQVDKAEVEKEKCWQVNQNGPAFLAASCSSQNIPLIHLSTDYVFDGDSQKPYTESSPISPLGEYGRSKAAGEEEVRLRLERHLIIRTSWVYGLHGRNFVKTILQLGQEKDELKVVADQIGCPTFAGDLASGLLAVCKQIQPGNMICWGTYHCCGSTSVTWYQFALHILELARKYHVVKVKRILPITSEEYPAAVRRPNYSVMNCEKIHNAFGIKLPNLLSSLEKYFSEFIM